MYVAVTMWRERPALRILLFAAALVVVGSVVGKLSPSVPAEAGVLSQAASPVTLNPSKDNTLYERATGSHSNGSGEFLFVGRTGANGNTLVRRGLVAFDE